jgi:hypothetical protein
MGIFNVLQIGLSMYICTNILTSSVITQSMNDSMNYLLMLPIGGCCGLGVYTLWMRSVCVSSSSFLEMTYPDSNYELATYWVPYAFFALSAAEIIQIPLGIAAGRLKSRYMLAGYFLTHLSSLSSISVESLSPFVVDLKVDRSPLAHHHRVGCHWDWMHPLCDSLVLQFHRPHEVLPLEHCQISHFSSSQLCASRDCLQSKSRRLLLLSQLHSGLSALLSLSFLSHLSSR